MLRAENSQTRRVSGETGHRLSPKPTLRVESPPESLEVPVLQQKSASVPSSPQDVPHNSGATWDRFPLVPQPRGGAPVVAKQSSHDGGSGPSSRSFPEGQSSAGGEGEPSTMGSMFTEWLQKLFAPHDGASSSSGAGAGVDAATGSKGGGHASSFSVVDRTVQAKDIMSNGESGVPGNGAGGAEKTSEDTDVPYNKTSLTMTDAAKPPSPTRATGGAAAHVQGYRPTHTEKHVSVKEADGTNVSLPFSSAVPPTSTAAVAAVASAGVVTAAAASGASHSSPRPPAVDAGDASNAATVSETEVEQPTNSPRFLGLFKGGTGGRGKQQQEQQLPDDGKGSSSTSNPSQENNSATAVAAAAAAAEEAAASATAAGVAAAAAAAGDGVSREGDRKPPVTGETTAAAVAAAVAAAAAEVVESEGTTPPPSSVQAPLKTALSGGGGSNMNGVDTPGEMTYTGSGTSGLYSEGKSNQTGPDYESGSGTGSGASSLGAREGGGLGVGGSRSGPGSRSTSPSRPTALSVGSDDGEEEHIYPAGSQQGSRPSIEDFSSLRVLGKGSYGKVVLVRRKNTGVLYAMKILKKGDVVRKRQVERTKIERRVLGNVEHPFLMRLHYAFQTDNKLYLVLDYCPGGELFFHLSRYKRFPEGVVRFYAAELVLALKHLHDNKIIYRDIKPENILLDADGHIKLGDFGLAKDNVEDSTFGAHSVCGTPEYMAPEVINKAGHGTAVDWWGLGMLMYEMLTGLPPWYTKDRQKLFERLREAPLVIPRNVSAPSSAIITGLLNRNPSKRLGTHGALQVMNHEFFRGLDWAALLAKRIPAPLNPCRNQRQGSESTHNFDPQFTRMPIDTMAVGGAAVSPGPDGHFEGFTYEVPGVILEDER